MISEIKDKQVEVYNIVSGYSSDEVYRKILGNAYRCLKKALVTSIVFLFIGVFVSVSVSTFIYRNYGDELNMVLSVILSVVISAFLTLLISLLGVFVSENYMDRNELDFLNGIFKDHTICSECDDCKVTINSSGVFFIMEGGKLVRVSRSVPKSVKTMLEEYYVMNYACVVRKVRVLSVYDESGKLSSYRGDV